MKSKTARRFLARNGHKLALGTRRAMLKRAEIARKIIRKETKNET